MPANSGWMVHEQTASKLVGTGCRRIRNVFGGVGAEKADDCLLRHQRGQRAGDKESGDQTEQHMGSEVGGQAGRSALQGTDENVHGLNIEPGSGNATPNDRSEKPSQ